MGKNTGVKCKMEIARFVWDAALGILGGTVAASKTQGAKTLGYLPIDAIVKDVTYTVVTPLASDGSATLGLGNSRSATAYLGATAKTAFDAEHETGGAALNVAEINESLNTEALCAFLMTIGTADALTGRVEFYVHYFVPKHSATD